MITIDLRLFGAFRQYSEQSSVQIELSAACNALALKEEIALQLKKMRPDLGGTDLVFESALANEKEILSDHAEIGASCKLAILPPVCGG